MQGKLEEVFLDFERQTDIPPETRERMTKMFAQFVTSVGKIATLKFTMGKKILVIWGSARCKPGTVAYQRAYRVAKAAGPDWVIIAGGGPGVMEAANKGAQDGGSISVGLNLVSGNIFEKDRNQFQDVVLFHEDFYSRLFAFMEFADAIVIADGGIGTVQEKMWAEGCIQCGAHKAVPIFILDSRLWKRSTALFEEQLVTGYVGEKERELVRKVKPGQEHLVFDRIRTYYANRTPAVGVFSAEEPANLRSHGGEGGKR